MSRIIDEASARAQNLGHQASEYANQAVSRGKQVAGDLAERGRSAVNSVGPEPVTRAAGAIPSDAFLLAAIGSIGISLTLKLMGRDRDAEFVGHWAPTFVTFGLLSKLISHDRHTHT
jgi:hypothetical protein